MPTFTQQQKSGMNADENENNPMHQEDFDSFHAACARSDAKIMAAMEGCRPRFQTGEEFQKEQSAHYAREATAAKVKAERHEVIILVAHAPLAVRSSVPAR
jgi:hypothetical protein